MNLLVSSIGEIARQNSNTIPVFRKYSIDFYCKGNRTLNEACSASGCDEKTLMKDLHDALLQNEDQNFDSWSSDKLMTHIVNSHHQYVNNHVPEISKLLKEVEDSGEFFDFDFKRIKSLFSQLANDMKQHMQKEELALFPYIKKLELCRSENLPLPEGTTVKSLVSVVEFEHDTSGIIIAQITRLCNGYSVPENATPLFSSLFQKLELFESDLIMHIHLENNVLHRNAIDLEMELALETVN